MESDPTTAPIVSIIVTAFNSGKFLIPALKSATEQSFRRHEIIVVDDGSGEDEAKFIAESVAQTPNARVIRQDNRGLSAARNTGAASAKGEYIAFLDHDDIWAAKFLDRLIVPLANNPALGAVFSRIQHMTADSQITTRVSKPKLKGLRIADFLTTDPACCGSSFIVRSSAFQQIGGFDPELIRAETPDLFIRLIGAHWKVEGVDDILVFYRNTPGSLSAGKELSKYRQLVLRKTVARFPHHGFSFWIPLLLHIEQIKIQLRRLILR